MEHERNGNTMFSDAIILVAGAELSDREKVLQTLGDQCHVVAAQTVDDALAHLNDSVDLVITVIKSSQVNGVELMQRWKARRPATPFLMLSEGRDVSNAVEAMKHGAADCLVKPLDADELRAAALQLVNSNETGNGAGPDRLPTNNQRRRTNIDIPPDTSLEDLERAAVEQALIQHHGNRTHAARTLGISVRTLQRKLKAWGMPMVTFSNPRQVNSFAFTSHSPAHHAYGVHAH
jgi:DNA-binding NtrC family response regulator